jgi:succinate-semialdehyde dehydrogenase/glutarate-semialdehyde dehydrogenase
MYSTIDPNTGILVKSFEHLGHNQLEARLADASSCFERWRFTSFPLRAAVLNRAAELLRSRADELAALATLEMGKRVEEARGEVMFSADILAYYAEHAETFLAPATLSPKVGNAHVESSPIGVIFAIEPWNFPFYQLARVAGPQLMAGNVVVVKHAACVPQCAMAFEHLLFDAGAPLGAWSNLMITHEQTNAVIDDPRIKGVSLTGGGDAGRTIAARAGFNLKKSVMELGGNDAFIVLDDADLDEAVPWAVWGRMYNAGQTCCAAKRFIVVDAVADAFIERFTAALEALQTGDPKNPTNTHGPMSSEPALLHLVNQVDVAIANGAVVLLGGRRMPRPGVFMQPTILTNLTRDNPAWREEFFGPVALVIRVRNEAEAIAVANDSDFGLGGSVWTRDEARGRRVASQINTGMMFINTIDWADAALPFGGIGSSGYGRELGPSGIQEFVNKKLVRVGDGHRPG